MGEEKREKKGEKGPLFGDNRPDCLVGEIDVGCSLYVEKSPLGGG